MAIAMNLPKATFPCSLTRVISPKKDRSKSDEDCQPRLSGSGRSWTMFRTDRHSCGAGYRGVVNKLVFLVAAAALSAIVAVHGETAAASRVSADSSKLAGAFVNWGAVG